MSTKLKIGIIGAAVLLALLGLFVVFVGMPMAQTRRGARAFRPTPERVHRQIGLQESQG